MHDGGFCTYHRHHIASPMLSSLSKYYLDDYSGGFPFRAYYGDGKGGVVPSTTHLSYQKFDCWTYGVDFVSYRNSDYLSIIHYNKYR